MGLKPRPKRLVRRPAGHHRHALPSRVVASAGRETPLPWRAWKVQNGSKGWYWRYPLAAEWGLEWFVYRLRSLALFELLELAGKLTIVVAVAAWFLEADQRARQAEEAIKARHYRAWDLINAARGSAGDGGRKDALQDLNKDHVSLATAPLEQAYLPEIDLEGALLMGANLERANLERANLERAVLFAAKLRGAILPSAKLQNANLAHADLGGAYLQNANLFGANLQDANLEGAYLQYAKLGHADLQGTNLKGADLRNANLESARNLDLAEAMIARCSPQTSKWAAPAATRRRPMYPLRLLSQQPRLNPAGR